MTDNLIERLRGYGDGNNDLMDAAADCIEKLEDELLHCFHRINALQTALRKIADIEHEDLPKPVGAAEGTLWVILAGCVEVAGKALEGKDD